MDIQSKVEYLFCANISPPFFPPARENRRLLQHASFLRMPLSAKTVIVCNVPLFPSVTSFSLACSVSAACASHFSVRGNEQHADQALERELKST